MAPSTTKMSQITPKPFAMSIPAGQVIACPWNKATTVLNAAPATNKATAMIPIHRLKTTTRPAQTVRRPGRWVNIVLRVDHENSEPA